MNELQSKLEEALRNAAKRLRNAGLPTDLVAQMERLATEVYQPCVVAVVGRVKAGKSTFINALLSEDLAKVGPTETTATINYFSYGPANPDFPVRCHWRGGKITDESRAFLDERQGNDLETLRKADSVDYLEYHLQNPYLQEITLVDTPGTGTEIDAHQNRTAEYLNLAGQLRKRHDEDTQRIGRDADAVIYLIGEVARELDRAFLEEFQQATQGQSRALNAIGVMAKIDLNPEIIRRREELSQNIAQQLQRSLNTVIPVSAGIQRALDDLLAQDQAGLKKMITTVRSINPQILDELLSDSDWYLEVGCPIPTTEWEQLRSQMPWRVFTTIARTVADQSLNEIAIVEQLQAIAGFDQLHKVLDQHFVKRGRLLRSYRIVNDALEILKAVQFTYLLELRRREAEDIARRNRFLTFIWQAQGNSPVARELAAFVEECLTPRADLHIVVKEVEREIARIKYELEDYNADFVALQQVQDHMDLFTLEELSELQPLFGLYGLETEKRLLPVHITPTYIGGRQQYWEGKNRLGRSPIVRTVAEQAVRRYGLIIETLM